MQESNLGRVPSKLKDQEADTSLRAWLRETLTSAKAKKNIRRFVLFVVVIGYTSFGALVYASNILKHPVKVGGQGKTDEVDETVYSKRKYNRGRNLPDADTPEIFQLLEHDVDIIHIENVKKDLGSSRLRLLKIIRNGTISEKSIEEALRTYELKMENSLSEGVSPLQLNLSEITPRWSFTQSIFFAATVLTTIGYGNIAPATHWGRIYCILFALVGIPLSVTMIGDMGEVFASLLPTESFRKFVPKGRMKTVVTIIAPFGLLISFIAVGGGLFWWFEGWSFLDSFYFCFITMTTIGFGDLVPAPSSLLVCGLYIMVGLAITSTVIELVRRQYAASWHRMKHMSTRIHQLSLPLAQAMRRMAETGSGEIVVDSELVRELQELNSAFNEVQNKTENNNSSCPDDPWQAILELTKKKKKITVFMYESSV